MIHPNRFAGKIAVVTGAAQGIGRDVALRIAREGGGLAMVDRVRAGRGGSSRGRGRRRPGDRDHRRPGNLRRCDRAMDSTLARFGRIDILINNVGGTIWAKPYAEYDPRARSRRRSAARLFPTLWCCRAVLPAMVDAGRRRHRQCFFRRHARRQPRALRGGERRRERDHRLLSPWNMRHTASASAAWRPAAPRPRRGASRATLPRNRANKKRSGTNRSSIRRLIQPDETLRHHRGTGRGDPVPGLRRGFVHHRRHPARGGRGSRLTETERNAAGDLRQSWRTKMSESLLDTQEVKDLLAKVSRLRQRLG